MQGLAAHTTMQPNDVDDDEAVVSAWLTDRQCLGMVYQARSSLTFHSLLNVVQSSSSRKSTLAWLPNTSCPLPPPPHPPGCRLARTLTYPLSPILLPFAYTLSSSPPPSTVPFYYGGFLNPYQGVYLRNRDRDLPPAQEGQGSL